ncbi:DUF4406 domain-containing protein [Paenibacillus naphthalenovorans]|uniref:DUF4406 domain-containing protein n=1 Tax=Paenibacillus naphthalenovorans TaxID=162209 RepID=UPI003D2B186D
MIIYISGPMSGLPDNNKPAFHAAAKLLRNLGHTVINPAEIEVPDPSWSNYMREDIRQMMAADIVVLLPGWANSRGAKLERHIAIEIGMPVRLIEEFEAVESA